MSIPGREIHTFAPARLAAFLAPAMVLIAACGGGGGDDGGGSGINGDGSSTVFPITEAVAEEYGKASGVEITVGISGTGGGFEKFCNGEIDFADASRPIKDAERDNCANDGIEFIDYQVAYDGLSVIANTSNSFVDCLTTAELKKIWETGSTIDNWSQVRDGFPDKKLTLYGPGTDSGTFDYFTSVITGQEGVSRSDYTASEDDNILVQGIEGDDGALGYFGYAYYVENQAKLKLLGVDPGTGCVKPSHDVILSNEYTPLSRPLYVYVNKESLKRPEVEAFMRFYLTDGVALVTEVGYVAAPQEIYEEGLAKLDLPN